MTVEAAAAQLAAGYQAPSRESLELFVAVQAQLAALPTTEMEAATQRLLAAESAVRRFQLPEDAGLSEGAKEHRRRPAWLSDLLVEALTTLAAHHAESLRRQEQGRQGEGGGDDKARGARRQARAAKRNAAVDCLVEAREIVIKRLDISSMDAAVIYRLAAIERELAAALHRRDGPTVDALAKLQWSLANLRRVEKLEQQHAALEPAGSEQRLAREGAVEELQWPLADMLSEVAAMSCALGLDESLFRAQEALEAWEAVVAADDKARDADEPPRSRGDARERLGEVLCLLAALHDEAGRLAESQRRYQRAVEALAASKGLGPDSLREAEAIYNRACVLLKMGEPEEALKLLERALRLFQMPRDAQGKVLAGSRAPAQPRHCIEAGLTLTNMIIGHEMLREWSAALAACEEAVQEYQMVLGKDHEQTGKLAKKRDRLRKKFETGGGGAMA
jgi:tetratricopeptide (TPR) repeat protein